MLFYIAFEYTKARVSQVLRLQLTTEMGFAELLTSITAVVDQVKPASQKSISNFARLNTRLQTDVIFTLHLIQSIHLP